MISKMSKRGLKKKHLWTPGIPEEEEEEPTTVTNGENTEADRLKTETAKLINRCAVFKHPEGLASLAEKLKPQEKHIPIIDQIDCLRRVLHYPAVSFFVNIFLRFYWRFAAVVPCLDRIIHFFFAIGGIVIVFISPFGLSLCDSIMCKILDFIEYLFPGIKSPIIKKNSISIKEVHCCDLTCCQNIDRSKYCCNHLDATMSDRKPSITETAHPECICQTQNKRSKPSLSLQDSTTEELGVDKN